jgi:predicted DNA-binding ribbon-helix-helix protein
MKDKQYKVRHIRMDDPVWEELKEKRRQSKFSWNMFIKQLIKQNDGSRIQKPDS